MIIEPQKMPSFDVISGIVRYLATPEELRGSAQCIMEGTLPGGIVVPLHTHPDPESFYLLEGEMELYLEDGSTSGWRTVRTGELAVIPGSAKHAWRNNSQVPCRALMVTGPFVYGFFRDIGRPVDGTHPAQAPDATVMAKVVEAAQRNQLWLATPQENEAIGIHLPPQP